MGEARRMVGPQQGPEIRYLSCFKIRARTRTKITRTNKKAQKHRSRCTRERGTDRQTDRRDRQDRQTGKAYRQAGRDRPGQTDEGKEERETQADNRGKQTVRRRNGREKGKMFKMGCDSIGWLTECTPNTATRCVVSVAREGGRGGHEEEAL